jgi:hypothetical protein
MAINNSIILNKNIIMLPEAAVQICDKVVLVAVLYNSYEVVIKKPNIQELLSLLIKHGPQ